MKTSTQVFEGSTKNVWKYIFFTNGFFLLTQYLGHIELHYDLPEIYEVSKLVINKTIQMLEAEDFQRDVRLIDKAYNLLDRFYIPKRDFFV